MFRSVCITTWSFDCIASVAAERLVAHNKFIGEFPVRPITVRFPASLLLSSDGVEKLERKDCLRVSEQILYHVRQKYQRHRRTEVSCRNQGFEFFTDFFQQFSIRVIV